MVTMHRASIVRTALGLLLFVLLLLPLGVQPAWAADDGPTTRVSVGLGGVEADGPSWTPAVSSDGCIVAFASTAGNLVSNDRSGRHDVFVYDCATDEILLVSNLPKHEDAHNAAVAGNGRFVAFDAYFPGAGSQVSEQQLFVYDRTTGQVAEVTGSEFTGAEEPALSADGRFIAFRAMTPGFHYNIFVHDRQTGQNMRVTTVVNGGESDSGSRAPVISADGCIVAFESDAGNLVENDRPAWRDVFVYSCDTNEIQLVSNLPEHEDAGKPAVSGDGRYVAFDAFYPGAGSDYPEWQVFVHDRETGQSMRVNGVEFIGPEQPALSRDGRFVAVRAVPSELRYNIFVSDWASNLAHPVSVGLHGEEADGGSWSPQLSGDGRYAVFASDAGNLVSGDTNGLTDIFIFDRWWNSQPVAVEDRYHTGPREALHVGSPGILGNDIAAGGNPRLYYFEANQHVYELGWFEGDWHTRDVTAEVGTPVAAIDSALLALDYRGQPRVYYISANHHVHELAWYQDAWHARDLTQESSAPPVVAGSALAGTTVNGQPRVYYLDAVQHIHELAWSDHDMTWTRADLTSSVGATPADQGSPLGATISANGDPRLFYLGRNQHVYELGWNGDSWFYWDVAEETGAPPAVLSGPLVVTTSGADPRVYYLAAAPNGQHIHELAWYDLAWHDTDLTAAAGAPVISTSDALAVTTYHNDPRLYYLAAVGDRHHIHELAWFDAAWHDSDLTDATAVATMAGDSALAVITYNTEPRVYFFNADHQVGELAWMSYLDPANATWSYSGVGQDTGAFPARAGSALGATIANLKPLQSRLVQDVAHGTLTLYEEGSFVYTPAEEYEGVDSFTYRADDGWTLSAETPVTISVGPPALAVDIEIALYRTPDAEAQARYESVIDYFADALYESSNGARKLGTVRIDSSTSSNRKADIIWVERCHPSASVASYGPNRIGHINMCDVFESCNDQGVCHVIHDFLDSDVGREHGGYTLAHEWGHYYFGLFDEYAGPKDGRWDSSPSFPHSTDDPVIPSIMHNQGKTIAGDSRDYGWLNFSTASVDTQNTAQFRMYGASGWETLARPASDDARRGVLAAGWNRLAFRDLQGVAPAVHQDALVELPGTARSALQIVWVTRAGAAGAAAPAAPYSVQLSSLLGTSISYPDPILLLASVQQELPLAHVGVQGTARLPDGRTAPIDFADDGRSPDALKDDGLYSALLAYSAEGVYTIDVRFDNDAGTATAVATAFEPSAGPNGEPIPLAPPMLVDEPFVRSGTLQIVVSGVMSDDHGSAPASASSLPANNEPLTGKIDYAGDADLFRVRTLADGTIYVRLTNLALGMTPRLRVLASDGTRVLFDVAADPAGYLYVALEGGAPESTIFAEVSDLSGSAVGGLYEISVGKQLASDVPPPFGLYLPYVTR